MTISGGINFSGIGNGTDFSQIVDKLKEVEAMPIKRLEAWKSDWNKRYEAFGEIIAAAREAKENLAKFNSPQKFLTKIASSSHENIIGAKANADAVDGTHTVEVKQLASNAIWALNDSYDSKTTKINTTGDAQNFSYTYKGTTRTLSVPNNTTVESFVNIVNQDRSNPGVKMSLIRTSDGYMMQIQGKDSGSSNDLSVHPANLTGLSGGTTKWQSNSTVDLTKTLGSFGADPKAYAYTVTMKGGGTFSVNADGDETNADLVTKINAASTLAGHGNIASIADGKLTLSNIEKMETSVAGSSVSTLTGAPTTKLSVIGSGTDQPLVAGATDKLFYEVTLADGATRTVELSKDATRKDLIAALSGIPGVSASAPSATGSYDITISGIQGIARKDAIGGATVTPLMDGLNTVNTDWAASMAAKDTDTIQSGVIPKNVAYSFVKADGSKVEFSLSSSATMQDLVNEMTSKGLNATVDADGKLNMTDVFFASGTGLSGQVAESSLWSIRKAQDAIFTVDAWPHDLTSSSNEVSDVLDGLTLTLKDIGKSQISVAADKDSVKENIQAVLDAINGVAKKVQELTKWDEQKQTVDPTKDEYAYSSQFSAEKGSVLTGNYGVQLFNTRLKTSMAGTPPGFTTRTGEDIFSGDFVSALAQMGIKTCTKEGDPNYGLFMIAPTGSTDAIQAMDQERFDDSIANHLEEVISFFASDDVGASSSTDFRYRNHIKGMTKPGNYSVSYTVASGGVIENVYINGVKASESDAEPGVFTVGNNAGDASGMSIAIDNLAVGSYNGTVSIKQGKVRQMEDFLGAELVFFKPTEKDPSIGKNNGGLMILQDNYMQIMNNIDKKIAQEQVRLSRWERTQRLAFSRLETVLGQYDRNMQSLTSQLGQLQQ